MIYTAADADFRGLEAEIDWKMMGNPGHAVHVSVYGDLLRGRNETKDSNLPRIPPARVGLGFGRESRKIRFWLMLRTGRGSKQGAGFVLLPAIGTQVPTVQSGTVVIRFQPKGIPFSMPSTPTPLILGRLKANFTLLVRT